MCTVSMIYDYGRQRIPDNVWTAPILHEFKGLVKKAEEFDTAAGQPDCVDPEKEAWMKAIEERIEKLEAAAFRAEKA